MFSLETVLLCFNSAWLIFGMINNIPSFFSTFASPPVLLLLLMRCVFIQIENPKGDRDMIAGSKVLQVTLSLNLLTLWVRKI